jgi:hypothetical protein
MEIDSDEEDVPGASRTSPLTTVKLHHVLVHAPQDILGHGHEKHYSAQVTELFMFDSGLTRCT